MSTYGIDLPARRTAWLADQAYQVRLIEQARSLAAAAGDVRPARLLLATASMPETQENAQLAEQDEVRVRFTFRAMDEPTGQVSRWRRLRWATWSTECEQN